MTTNLLETNGSNGQTSHSAPQNENDVDARAPDILAIGRESLKDFQTLLAENREGVSVDFVHDLRVATRRLGEVVGIVEALMDAPAAKAVSNALRQTRREAGELRDLDVMEEHLEKWRLPAAVKKAKEEILQELPARRAALADELRAQLQGASLAGAQAVLAHVLEDKTNELPERQEKLASVLRKHVKRRRKQLRQAFGRAATKQTPKALHEARIGAKKLRYAMELADEAGMANGRGELKFLKRVQKELGEMHDADVIVATLEGHMHAALSPRARVTWRKWVRGVQKKQGERAGHFFVRSYLWMNKKV